MKTKPRYGILQNIGFMLRCAWVSAKPVPFVAFLMALLTVALNLGQLYVAPQILEKVEDHAPLEQLLLTIGLFALLLFFLQALQAYGRENRMMGEIDVRTEIIRRINAKTAETSYPNILDPERDKLLNKAMETTSGNSGPAEHIWRTLTDLTANIIGFLLYLMLLSSLDLWLLVVVLATTVLSFLVSLKGNSWSYRHKQEQGKLLQQLYYAGKTARSASMAKDIRIFGLSDWLQELNEKTLRAYEAFVNRREKALLLGNAADVVLTFLRNGIAYWYLIRLTLAEELPASRFLLYFTAVSGLTAWVSGILNQFAALHKESVELSVVQEYIHAPEEFRFGEGKPLPKGKELELQLENVSFSYPGSDRKVLENLNLTIRPGEKLAIVGLNGAGKTTLVKLLCGFYDPTEGAVLLNGQDIREFDRKAYYSLFSGVFQEYALMDVTIAQQVAGTAENYDCEKVWSCLAKAGLQKFVEGLPKGLDTHMGREVYLDGILLSGGQTQRLLLARALYKDGGILMLDEPTAALDPIAENDIYEKYSEMTSGKTSVFISHRLASTRFCDRIVFVAEGNILEEGTHEQLLARNGEYAKLFHIQSRYYQEGGEKHGETA